MSLRVPHRTRTVSITSGKGGVGKTTVLSNIAYGLASQGRRVLILDGDFGMANVDIFFGAKTNGNLLEVLRGEKTVDQIITPIATNIDLISGGTGLVELNRLSVFERRALLESVMQLEFRYDDLLVDTAPGISDNVLHLNSSVDSIGMIITPDPASLTDSYALIKVLNKEYKTAHFSIICNMVRDEAEGLSLYSRFSEVVNRFLSIGLDYWGAVPHDPLLRKATQMQRLIMKQDAANSASVALRMIANQIQNKHERGGANEASPLFWEQVMGVA